MANRTKPVDRHALAAAAQAMQMQRPDEAERIATQILATDRDNIYAMQILGHALILQTRFRDAIAPLERAAGRGDDPAIDTLLATALAGGGRPDDALALLQRTTARRPLYPPAVLELSAQLSKAGHLDDATAALQAGILTAPDVAEFRLELGYHHLRRNDRTRARAVFEEVFAVAPERHDATTALAKVMALDGDYVAAAALYRRILAQHPQDAMSRSNLGICLLETGERDAGEACLREAARMVPHIAGHAITALAAASHGRFFLKPSAAIAFLQNDRT